VPHPLVEQLRFARAEFQRGLVGVTGVEAQERFLPMNCISWNVGHLAWHEQRHWLINEQQITLFPDIDRTFASGAPASTPALEDVQMAWQTITSAADPWLDSLTTEQLLQPFTQKGKPGRFNLGSRFHRMIYHYWFHTGENAAIRQMLGHSDLPQYVGPVEDSAPYRLDE
jgi:hypothetical protein